MKVTNYDEFASNMSVYEYFNQLKKVNEAFFEKFKLISITELVSTLLDKIKSAYNSEILSKVSGKFQVGIDSIRNSERL